MLRFFQILILLLMSLWASKPVDIVSFSKKGIEANFEKSIDVYQDELNLGSVGARGPPAYSYDFASISLVASKTNGLDKLSPGEIKQIQNAADRVQKPVHLVGSRASGTAKATSDWDYVVEGLNSKGFDKIKNSLPGAPSRIDGAPRNMDIFRTVLDPSKPVITFTPKAR